MALRTSIDQLHDDIAKALEADLVQTRKLILEKHHHPLPDILCIALLQVLSQCLTSQTAISPTFLLLAQRDEEVSEIGVVHESQLLSRSKDWLMKQLLKRKRIKKSQMY